MYSTPGAIRTGLQITTSAPSLPTTRTHPNTKGPKNLKTPPTTSASRLKNENLSPPFPRTDQAQLPPTQQAEATTRENHPHSRRLRHPSQARHALASEARAQQVQPRQQSPSLETGLGTSAVALLCRPRARPRMGPCPALPYLASHYLAQWAGTG